MLQLRDFTCTDSTGRPLWSELNVDFVPGELVAVAGPVGSGKTTLLRAICGLVPEFWNAEVSGRRVLDSLGISGLKPHETAARISFVSQQPTLGFVAETVRDEIAFGPTQLGLDANSINARILDVASQLEIADLLDRRVQELSGGEQQLVAIAAALASGADYVLLDEPTSRLDEINSKRINSTLSRLADEKKICVVLTTHDSEQGNLKFDRVINLGSTSIPERSFNQVAKTRGPDQVENYDLDRFTMRAGEIVGLTGPNAIGKSRLLDAIYDGASSGIRCVMVPQEPADLLIFETVALELTDADKLRDTDPGTTFARLRALGFDLQPDAHPRDLSAGQQLALVLAIQLSREADLLLLDEPNRGLEHATLNLLRQAIANLAAAGTAVVVVSHNRAFLAGLIDRELRLTETGLEQVSR